MEMMSMAVRWVLAVVLTVQERKRVHLYVAHVVIGKEGTHCVHMENIGSAYECQRECQNNEDCQFFTWNSGTGPGNWNKKNANTCWLKKRPRNC